MKDESTSIFRVFERFMIYFDCYYYILVRMRLFHKYENLEYVILSTANDPVLMDILDSSLHCVPFRMTLLGQPHLPGIYLTTEKLTECLLPLTRIVQR